MRPFSTLTYICCGSCDIHQPDGKVIAEMSGQKICVTVIIYLPKSPEHLRWQVDNSGNILPLLCQPAIGNISVLSIQKRLLLITKINMLWCEKTVRL